MAIVEAPATTRLDVEDVLRAGGFTRFHRRAVVVTGVAWTFVAMEILLVAFVLPVLTDVWALSATWAGWLGSSALAGALVGALVLGRLADRIGRREIFQLAILWYAAFTAATALSWGPESFFALRFLAGIGLGGMLVVDPSLLAEYLPPQRRGRFLVFLDFWWPVGFLVAIGLSYVFLAQLGNEWRWLFVAAAFPAFLAFVARLFLPESPYFLARKGRMEEASAVLHGITGNAVEPARLDVRPEPRSRFADLLERRLLPTSLMIVTVWIALNISYYGLFIWLPGVLAIGEFGIDPYLLLTLIALAQFPGYGASLYLVEAWGRRRTLATFLALGGASALTFALAESTAVYVAALFFVGFFNLGAWGAVYPYTSELFPTRVRSSAFGMVEGVGKGAAIGGPYLFGALIDWTGDVVWSLSFVAAVMAAGAVATLFGRETRGQKLA
jgi:MFS transporter, putative metabolite:H+ symporter